MSTLNIILTHQAPTNVARMVEWWAALVGETQIAIAYGGTEEDFDKITFQRKFYVDGNPRLRTGDHPRERQSYASVFRSAVALGFVDDYEHIHLSEFDQIPLIPDVNQCQKEFLLREGADVVGYQVCRIDHTNHAHYLDHAYEPKFHQFLNNISVRKETEIVLTMLGFGGFWTREAFSALANVEEDCPIYLEIFMPTVAHHLGFRVRSVDEHSEFISKKRHYSQQDLLAAQAAKAWFIHPIKDQWNTTIT